MSVLSLVAFIALPALVAPLLFLPDRVGRTTRRILPWSALPVLILAALPIGHARVELPWLVLGSAFEVDPVGRTFLIVAALLWTAAGVYASRYIEEREQTRFFFYFALTMTGNLGVTIAADAVTFYLFFALMTFAAYSLIVHRADPEAKWAGRVYLVMAVIGEALLLAGLMMAVDAAGTSSLAVVPGAVGASASAGTITILLILGFAIKAGAVPLHVWLPLAHPVAPTPASAVLSGCIIKAGLLGWLRFLPLGEAVQPVWGSGMIALGVVAAFFGVAVGVVQTDPKTVLAYSSISQMGLMNVGIGIALKEPVAAIPAIAAVTLFAAHHGLAKGSLFLGVGVASAGDRRHPPRPLVMAGLGFSALALAGAPLTSGHLAKSELKALFPLAGGAWPDGLDIFLPISAGATALLLLRFLHLIRLAPEAGPEHRLRPGLWGPWAVLITGSAAAFWVIAGAVPEAPTFSAVVLELAPIALAVAAYGAVARRSPSWSAAREPLIRPGDILHPVERWLAAVPRPHALIDRAATVTLAPRVARRWYRIYSESAAEDPLIRAETALTRWAVAITLVLMVTALLLLLLSLG